MNVRSFADDNKHWNTVEGPETPLCRVETMSAQVNSNGPTYGTLNRISFFSLPPIPPIVSEWAGLMPLVIHLASYRHEYRTVGEIALLGRLHAGLFPRLGLLAGLARLLERGPDFLDQASMRGSSSTRVWDVHWGSSFPCANGAASEIIAAYAIATRENKPVLVTENVESSKAEPQSSSAIGTGNFGSSTASKQQAAAKSAFRRPQTLHLLHFSQLEPKHAPPTVLSSGQLSVIKRTTLLAIAFCAAVAAGLCGCYGTCVILTFTTLSQLLISSFRVTRTPGYLENNEEHEANMLVATHENASTWYLYSGDRAVVDALLNKTMFSIPKHALRKLLASWLRVAHAVQLLAMTYVAAEKGWDGVGLVLLVLVDAMLRLLYRDEALAQHWLESENITVNTTTFEFSGRTVMLGAVQAYSKSNIRTWMDDILVPHPRRDAFFSRIEYPETFNEEGWSAHDLKAILTSSTLARLGASMMQKAMPTSA